MLLCYATADFHLFYDVAADVQKWALLTRSQCRVSDIQVPVKACEPLVQTKYHAVFQWDLTTTFKGNCIIIHVALLKFTASKCFSCTFKQTSFLLKLHEELTKENLLI